MPRRIRLTLQYDGSAYSGWQVQPCGTTLQGLLEEALNRLTGERAKVTAAGRTDAGVHAIEQVAAFDTRSELRCEVMKKALNAMLPADMLVSDAVEADMDFHPRYSARSKKYIYFISDRSDKSDRSESPEIPVFLNKYVWRVRYPLDTEVMREAAACLPGRHDFSSFRGSGCGAKNPERTVSRLEIERFEEAEVVFTKFRGRFIRISIEADAFLRHMVRNIIGTLVEVGRKKIAPGAVRDILESKDRRLAGPTAPPEGLFLEKVTY